MHQPSRTKLLGTSMALLLVLPGCGGGSGGSSEETSTAALSTTTSGPAATTSGPGGTTKRQKAMIERPSGAPLGEVFPPGDDAYLLLAKGRCGELLKRTDTWRQGDNQVNEDAFFLYRAAAEACLNRWDDAQKDVAKLQALAPTFSGGCDSSNCERCMRAVKEWLDGALAAHRKSAGSDVEYVAGTKASPCPEGVGTPDEGTPTTAGATTSSRRGPTTSRTTSTTAP